MPELPEVETVKRELESKIVGHKIVDIKTDWPKTIRNIALEKFRKKVVGLVIESIERKGKFIFFRLSGDTTIVAHLRMTGHFIVSSCWNFNGKKIIKDMRIECLDKENDIFIDKKNSFIHLSISLNKNRNLLLSDVRKFATIDLIDNQNLEKYKAQIGIDALDEKLTLKVFRGIIRGKTKEIKKTLLDQTLISGVGNIYADEILFKSSVLPQRPTKLLEAVEIRKIFLSMKKILKKAVILGGTSFSDFRNTEGKTGNYGTETKVYRKKGLKCPKKCGNKIKRIVIGGRGTHYCPSCQK